MAEKTLKTRIQLKNDTEDNWNKSNFTPLLGETIIYSIDNSHPYFRLKIGNGSSNINNLPFIDSSTVEGKTIKIKTTAEWNLISSYIPNQGDILIYSDKTTNSQGTSIPGIKIGDGKAYCVDLPFIGDDLVNILNSHIDNTNIHITSTERTQWNNKINCSDTVINETLVFVRN